MDTSQGGSGAVGDYSMESADWRSRLQADSRERIVNKIIDTLKRHIPFSGHEGLQELKKIAEGFEEKIYTAATSQSDYLRKISLKMLTMETRSQNPMQSSSVADYYIANPSDPGYQVMQQVYSQRQPLPISVPFNNPQSVQQQLLLQTMHNNLGSTGIQGSSSLLSALPPGTGLLQSTMPNVAGRISNLREAFPTSLDFTAQMGSANGGEEVSNWKRSQGGSGAIGGSFMESGDWRAQLQPDTRERIVNKIMDTLKRHLPFSGQEGLQELNKIAVRVEESIYTSATSQSDYLRKISLKMLTMETRSQNPMPDAMQSNSSANMIFRSQVMQQGQPLLISVPYNHPQSGQQQLLSQTMHNILGSTGMQGSSSLSSALPPGTGLPQSTVADQYSTLPHPTAQTDYENGGDWQEEVYQKIKAMKDLYLLDLNDFHQKVVDKLQQHDSRPQQLNPNMLHIKQQEQLLQSQQLKQFQHRQMQHQFLHKQQLMQQQQFKQQQPGNQQLTQLHQQAMPHMQSQPQLQQQAMPHMQSQSGQLQQQVGMQQQPNLLQQRLPTSGGFQQQNVIDQQKQIFQQQRPMPEASSTSLDSTAGNTNGADWQEEVYQKIKAMKDLYLLDLNDMHQKILGKLQQHDSLPQQPKNEQLEKLKVFKNMLERFMAFLQLPKHNIVANYKDKLSTYEKQIVNVINSNLRKPPPQGQPQPLVPPQQTHEIPILTSPLLAKLAGQDKKHGVVASNGSEKSSAAEEHLGLKDHSLTPKILLYLERFLTFLFICYISTVIMSIFIA